MWQLYQRTIIPKEFLHCCESSRPTTDFPTWVSSKETENPQGIWLWRPVGFDYRTSTELGKQKLLEDTNKTLWALGPRRKEQWPHKRVSQTCLWVSWSLQQRHGLTVACWGVRGTDYNSPGGCGVLAQGGAVACWHKAFWRRSPLPLPRLASGQTTGREHSPTY